MRLIPTLVLLLTSLWATSTTEGYESCSSPGYFPNPSDCSRFYRCTDHSTEDGYSLVRYDFDCPHETVFDPSVDVCVFPTGHGCPGGWAKPSGWAPPQKGWSPPKPKGWAPPQKGWSPPDKGWAPPPTKGWAPPPTKGWAPPPPPKGWAPPPPPPRPKGWSPPQKGWAPPPPPPPKGWSPPPPPTKGWAPPPKPKGWSPPSKGWSPPAPKGWSPPSNGWDSSNELFPEGSDQLGLTPGNSYIIIYEDEDRKKGSEEDF